MGWVRETQSCVGQFSFRQAASRTSTRTRSRAQMRVIASTHCGLSAAIRSAIPFSRCQPIRRNPHRRKWRSILVRMPANSPTASAMWLPTF